MAQLKSQSENIADVVIVGAGPYGLSIAAHLADSGIRFRIFGDPMSIWQKHMPKGMRLKSEGFASSLSDPRSQFTLRHYCQQEGIEYADVGEPVRLDTFVAYGLAFQRKFVPNLEEKFVVSLQESLVGFELQLEDGEKVLARSVVVAVGISYYSYLPPVLAGLPKEVVSHSSAHSDLAGIQGSQRCGCRSRRLGTRYRGVAARGWCIGSGDRARLRDSLSDPAGREEFSSGIDCSIPELVSVPACSCISMPICLICSGTCPKGLGSIESGKLLAPLLRGLRKSKSTARFHFI